MRLFDFCHLHLKRLFFGDRFSLETDIWRVLIYPIYLSSFRCYAMLCHMTLTRRKHLGEREKWGLRILDIPIHYICLSSFYLI